METQLRVIVLLLVTYECHCQIETSPVMEYGRNNISY